MGLSSSLRPLIVFLIFIISVLAIQITPVSAELKVSTQPQGDKRTNSGSKHATRWSTSLIVFIYCS
ncbi:hypothetical protein ERO13_D09G051500v2 [Gossypium hirsutum]|nr:hypothetical protein ERO13_D09G051500v2 [Gossypium hirsutum]